MPWKADLPAAMFSATLCGYDTRKIRSFTMMYSFLFFFLGLACTLAALYCLKKTSS